MARTSKSAGLSFSINLSQEQVFAAVMANPELQAGVVAQFQQGIGSPTPSKRSASTAQRSPSGRVRRGAHHEMAIKSLAACGAIKSADKGVYSKAVKSKGTELGHSFGSTLNATLDTLIEKGIVEYKNVAKKGAGKKRYLFWLAGTEAEALQSASSANSDAN